MKGSKNGVFLFWSMIILVCVGCVEAIHQYSFLPPGVWRGVLKLDQVENIEAGGISTNKISRITAPGELPFNFSVIYDDSDSFHIEIINGEEQIVLSNIRYGRDKATAHDTIVIEFPVYDSFIKGIFKENMIEGRWYVPNRGAYSIPFVAYHGQSHRFTTMAEKPITDLTGNWKVKFEVGTEKKYPAVGEFSQKQNSLKGTFLTEIGDYRYLEGTIQAERFYLSCFDGSHAFLFEGRVTEEDKILGTFRSGIHYETIWEAERNSDFHIKDPFSITHSIYPNSNFQFEFENLDGKMVRLDDDKYEGKIKLVQIIGTWCPNCLDETKFLLDYLNSADTTDVCVIVIAFEKYKQKDKAISVLKNYQKRLNIPFEILYGGYYDKKIASEEFPQINEITAYPTLIFLDRSNKIFKIHTGFAGPATSKYDNFIREFNSSMQKLLESI